MNSILTDSLKNRFFLFLISLFFFSNNNFAQTYLPPGQKPDTRYYHARHGKWAASYKSLFISPEIYGFDHWKIGVSIGEMEGGTGEGGGNAKVMQAGFEYLPTKGIIAPKVAIWKGGWVFGMGAKMGINGLYYFRKDASSFAFRPMIGIGVIYFQFNYGYTFFANKNFNDLNSHSFSLSWHHTILPRRGK